MNLQHSRLLQIWAGTPLQHKQENRLYRRMRVGAAQRELSRDQVAGFLSRGYSLVTHQDWAHSVSTTVLPVGDRFWYKARDHHWWLGKISAHTKTVAHYVVRFLDDPRPVKLKLSPPGTLRLLERNAARGAFKLVKVVPSSRGVCATSTSTMESNLPTPSRLIDVAGINGWFSTGIGSSQVIRVFLFCFSASRVLRPDDYLRHVLHFYARDLVRLSSSDSL